MKKSISLLLILVFINFSEAQVGINTINPNASAELDVTSTTRGLLLPRLTTAAITTLTATASEGLLVFDTNKKLFLGFDGTNWQVLGNANYPTISFANWEISGYTGGGASPQAASAINQISSASLERGAGLTAASLAGLWGSVGYDAGTNLSTAITNNDYATISLVLPPASKFSFIKIGTHNIRRSATAPPNVQWQYSIDGTNFTNLGSVISLPDTTALGNNISEIPLNSIYNLQSLTNLTVIFRLVGYGGTNTTGTLYINDISGNDLEIVGMVH